jgi:hypothetical protein
MQLPLGLWLHFLLPRYCVGLASLRALSFAGLLFEWSFAFEEPADAFRFAGSVQVL